MPRTVTLTTTDDVFVQGFGASNINVTVLALAGNDTIQLNRDDDLGGGNFVNAGDGNDEVLNLDEDGSTIFLGLGADTYVGTGFGSLTGEAADTVFGGAGNDRFAFSTFKSIYEGGNDNDTFFSEGQQNTIRGGAGNDTVSYRPREASDGGVTINLQTQRVNTGAFAVETLASIENAEGSVQNDRIIGNGQANRLTGGGGLDGLTGGAGADVFVYVRITDAPIADFVDEITDFSRAQGDRIDLRGIDADASVAGNQSFLFRGANAFTGDQRQLRLENLGDGRGLLLGDRTGDGVADFRILLDGVTTLRSADFLL